MTNICKIIDEWAILGRPGYAGKNKKKRRNELQKKFGKDNWKIAHLVEGKLLSREEALFHFEESYYVFFEKNPEILEWLIYTAKDVYDTDPSNIHSGTDYTIQETEAAHLHDIAIRRALQRMSKDFQGEKLLQIRGEESEGFILTTGQVPFYKPKLIHNPQIKGWWEKNSIESFWQSNKVLAVKLKKLEQLTSDLVAIILRQDVHMGKGKFSTQAAHAAVSLFMEKNVNWNLDENPFEIWTIKGEVNLNTTYSLFDSMNVQCVQIRDAGKTQLTPGTKTAVGVGSINVALFDSVMAKVDAKPLESSERIYSKFNNFHLWDLG